MPPKQWKPSILVDLNYTEDSPGREYALQVGAEYVSGLRMFQVQAEKQREFWLREEARVKRSAFK
jgi:shikimate 5-dehydrogenase